MYRFTKNILKYDIFNYNSNIRNSYEQHQLNRRLHQQKYIRSAVAHHSYFANQHEKVPT